MRAVSKLLKPFLLTPVRHKSFADTKQQQKFIKQASERLMFKEKKIFMKGHSIIKDNHLFIITPYNSLFEETDFGYKVSRNGYLMLSFCELNDDKKVIKDKSK